jgi:hypothetical protein
VGTRLLNLPGSIDIDLGGLSIASRFKRARLPSRLSRLNKGNLVCVRNADPFPSTQCVSAFGHLRLKPTRERADHVVSRIDKVSGPKAGDNVDQWVSQIAENKGRYVRLSRTSMIIFINFLLPRRGLFPPQG